MDCNDVKALLSGLMDGQLEPNARHEAERHLATCAGCRDLLDRAEQVDFALSRSMHAQAGSALPTGFVEFVLGQTSRSPSMRAGRWTNYFGWMAAAASLVLAMTIWVMDRRSFIRHEVTRDMGGPSESSGRSGGSRSVVSTVYTPGSELQSFILDNNPDGLPQSIVVDDDAARQVARADSRGRDSHRAATVVAAAHTYALLEPGDGDALMTAWMLLEQLQHADDRSFAAVERIRQAAEYEQLVPQLRELRERVLASDRTSVYAAEAVFRRLIEGPLSQDDLAELRRTVAQLNLTEVMRDMGAAEVAANSL